MKGKVSELLESQFLSFRYFYRGRGYYRNLLFGYGVLPKDIEPRQRVYLVFVILEKLFFLVYNRDRFPGRLQSDVSLLRELIAAG